jgi:hypothetical protein
MGLINWIFDLYQQSRIEQLHDEAAQARADALRLRATSGTIDPARTERALGELALAVKTLQRLAVQKGLCTPDELARLVDTIDREDGTADGLSPLR